VPFSSLSHTRGIIEIGIIFIKKDITHTYIPEPEHEKGMSAYLKYLFTCSVWARVETI
jgi:hypothetical protein